MILYLVSLIFFSQVVFAQIVDTQKTDIYSKLKDRRCTMSLDKCDCPDAKEMKAYIDALLETGVAKEDIFYKVAKKFSPKVILDEQIKSEVEQRLIKETGDKRSQVIFEPTSLDFGKASKKQAKVNKIFKVYNKGNIDLIITNIRASCGCVSAALKVGKNKSPYFGVAGANPGWQAAIEPGKSGELEVALDLNHSSMDIGKQMRKIFISNNDPLNPEATLKVEIEVTE
ncbi:MAG: DUF1573 domain-containing protein [Candidatus Omnitrophota bacterium]